jgi:glycosyltransferase involved in cell wall biosynthesis
MTNPTLVSVSPYRSYPANTGGKRRMQFLNRGFARLGWPVSIHSVSHWGFRPLGPDVVVDHAPGLCEFNYHSPFLPFANRMLWHLGAQQLAQSYLPRLLFPLARFHRRVAAADVVMFEHPHSLDMVRPKALKGKFVILDAHNIEAALPPDTGNVVARHLWQQLENCERRAMHRADLVLMCTQQDIDLAVAKYGVSPAKLFLAPNGCEAGNPILPDDEKLRLKAELGLGAGPVAIFAGSDWGPNVEAAEATVDLAALCPDWTFVILGKAGDGVTRAIPGNVRRLGYVPDVAPWFRAADLGLNPMFSGGGSNIKLFDYLSYGLPVLSTPFGVRGIDPLDARAVIVTEKAGFAPALAALIAAADLPERSMAAAAMAHHFDWDSIAARASAAITAAMVARA